LKRRVAVKIVRSGRISPQARDRLLREQRVSPGCIEPLGEINLNKTSIPTCGRR